MGLSRTLSRLSDLTWPEVAEGQLLAVPLGSCEQHGPHLPLDTDSRIAQALADRLAHDTGVVVGPLIAVGSSGEHAGFAGTLSIGQAALEHVVVELVRSADIFGGVILVNGHGGNTEVLGRAVTTLTAEGRRAIAWSPTGNAGGDAHAGRTETSVMLHLAPDAVRLERAAAGNTTTMTQLIPALQQHGVKAVSPNGVLGDPAGASAAEGQTIFDRWARELCAAVKAWRS
jgi:mycofactocin precursor peptide peptidase